MRKFATVALALAALVLVAGEANAQRGGGGRGGRGGRGGMAPGGAQGLLFLLQNESVQKELKLDKDDLEKLPGAIEDAVKKILKPEQYKRLQQIALQQRGEMAFTDEKIQKTLSFSDDQKDKVKTIMKDFNEGMKEIREAGFGRESMQKMQELRKETGTKLGKVLTDSQKKQWKKMVGDKFEIKYPQRGGRRGGGQDR
jgi:hypothetical protein